MSDRARRPVPAIAAAAVALVSWLAAQAAPRGSEAEPIDFRAIFGERYDDAVDYLQQNPWDALGLRLPGAAHLTVQFRPSAGASL